MPPLPHAIFAPIDSYIHTATNVYVILLLRGKIYEDSFGTQDEHFGYGLSVF